MAIIDQEIMRMLWILGTRVIHNCRSQICSQISHKSNTIVDKRFLIMKLAHYVINKLTPHGMPKIQKISPKFMLTQQTFDTCMFQFPF